MSKQMKAGEFLSRFHVREDSRGALVAIEGARDIGFDIRRVYYVYGSAAGVERGFHAHLALRQLAICVSGGCTFVLDDGYHREEIRLERPDAALAIEPMIWHEMKEFTANCVLLVLASNVYDEADYIRSYDEFLNLAGAEAAR